VGSKFDAITVNEVSSHKTEGPVACEVVCRSFMYNMPSSNCREKETYKRWVQGINWLTFNKKWGIAAFLSIENQNSKTVKVLAGPVKLETFKKTNHSRTKKTEKSQQCSADLRSYSIGHMYGKNEEMFAHFKAFYNAACQIYYICILFYMLSRVFLGRINFHILVSFHNILDL